MAEINDLSVIDGDNGNRTIENAGFPTDIRLRDINNSMRALEGIIARWENDLNGTLTTAGTEAAYTVTLNRTISALYDGLVIAAEIHLTNTGAATLNVSSTSAVDIRKSGNLPLVAGDLQAGQRAFFAYDGTVWQLLTPGNLASLSSNIFTSPQIVSAPTGPALLNLLSGSDTGTIGRLIGLGHNSAAADVEYASVDFSVVDNTDGSEDGSVGYRTVAAGAFATRLNVTQGLHMSVATGGDQGAGTINASDYYVDGTLLTQPWTPVYGIVLDGNRRVIQLLDWIGGTGTKPGNINDFVSDNGFVSLANQATNIRGPTGPTGPTGATGPVGPEGPEGPPG